MRDTEREGMRKIEGKREGVQRRMDETCSLRQAERVL